MQIGSIATLRPGTEVTTTLNNGIINSLLGKTQTEKKVILGESVGWKVPIKVLTENGSYYSLINEQKLQETISTKNTTVKAHNELSITDKNFRALWECHGLWSINGTYKPHLIEGIKIWAILKDNLITDIAFKEPKEASSYVELFAPDEYSLGLANKINMPPEFYRTLEDLNWLLENLRSSTST